MAKPKHLSKTPFVIWCDEKLKIEAHHAEPKRTTFPTEVTCLRCLQLAVIWFQQMYFQANGERSFDNKNKEPDHG